MNRLNAGIVSGPMDPAEYDWNEPCDEAEDDFEIAMQNCGLHTEEDGTEICLKAGTEYCDFVCPFRDAYYERMKKASDSEMGESDAGA